MGNLKTPISRRRFLKVSAAVSAMLGLGFLPGRIIQAKTAQDPPTNPNQVGFMYDQQKCIGCKRCQMACKNANKWDEGIEWRRVLTGKNKGNFLSISCNHCDNPACMTVCPVSAYTKRDQDGIVIHDPEKCVGCKYCTYACPYHAPQFSHATGRISKCHFCFELQDKGENPACVASCPTGALTYGVLSNLRKTKGGTNQIEGLPSAELTKPSWVIIPR